MCSSRASAVPPGSPDATRGPGTFPAATRSNAGEGGCLEASDEQLVEACRGGDPDAFALLVRRHQKSMLNLAFRLLGDLEEACEAVQDAFLDAHRGLDRFRREARFSTWLAAITLNGSRDRLARLATRRRREAYSLDAPITTARGTVVPDPPSTAPDALADLEQAALRARVADCLQALPLEFRTVMVLRDLQDRSYEEIAALLGARPGTVKSRLFRAREGIRECLERIRRNP
jgi:RNA polymerase sigma-70 factor (ECF subfamily)